MEVIEKWVEYVPNDLQRAYDLNYRVFYPIQSRLLLILGVLFLMAGVLGGLLAYINNFNILYWMLCIVYGVVIVGIHYRRYHTLGKRMFEKVRQFRHPVRYIIGEQGMEIHTTDSSSTSQWNSIEMAVLRDDFLMLYLNPFMFRLLPKRVFSDEEYVALCALVRKKVKDCR